MADMQDPHITLRNLLYGTVKKKDDTNAPVQTPFAREPATLPKVTIDCVAAPGEISTFKETLFRGVYQITCWSEDQAEAWAMLEDVRAVIEANTTTQNEDPARVDLVIMREYGRVIRDVLSAAQVATGYLCTVELHWTGSLS